jgi:hypothetical protein
MTGEIPRFEQANKLANTDPQLQEPDSPRKLRSGCRQR